MPSNGSDAAALFHPSCCPTWPPPSAINSSLEIPKDWTFRSGEIANHFDQHVREQLPWYDVATNAVAQFSRYYIPQGGVVYDIGA